MNTHTHTHTHTSYISLLTKVLRAAQAPVDASEEFEGVGHSSRARVLMDQFKIGTLEGCTVVGQIVDSADTDDEGTIETAQRNGNGNNPLLKYALGAALGIAVALLLKCK